MARSRTATRWTRITQTHLRLRTCAISMITFLSAVAAQYSFPREKRRRWYPTTVLLPDGRILILSGTDQDTSVGPELASRTKYRIVTPEVSQHTHTHTAGLAR